MYSQVEKIDVRQDNIKLSIMKFRSVFLLFVLLLLGVIDCSKKSPDDPPAGFVMDEIRGKWKIIPSIDNEVLIITNDKGVLETSLGSQLVDIKPDSLGIRVLEQGNLTGYFVFTEKRSGKWKGIWKENLVELTLQPN